MTSRRLLPALLSENSLLGERPSPCLRSAAVPRIFSNSDDGYCEWTCALIRDENGPCNDFLPVLQPRVTEEHRIDIDAITHIQIVRRIMLGRTVEPGCGQYDAMIVKIEFRQLASS